MARKKKTGTTATKDKDDGIDDLADEIEQDLAKEFDFEDPPEVEEVKDYVDKVVSFQSDDGDTITGKVVKQDGEKLTIEDDAAFWTATVEDVDVLKAGAPDGDASDEDLGLAEEKPAGKKPPKKKKPSKKPAGKKPPKAPKPPKPPKGKKAATPPKLPKAEKPEVEADSRVTERRMLPISSIKITKIKAREVDREDDEYKALKENIRKFGQKDSLRIQSWSNPYLIGGGNRLAIFEELNEKYPGKGWDAIECQQDETVQDSDDRLMASLMDNEFRIRVHWVDQAKAFARLIKGGKYTQAKIAKAMGMSPSTVSRMTAALKLPKGTLEVARDAEHAVPPGVFQEMASAPKQVVKELTAAISEGRNVTMADVRALKKAADKEARDKDKPDAKPERTRTPSDPVKAYTYRDLGKADVGDFIRIRVHGDHVELRFHVEWDKKQFRNFDPVDEVKGLFDAVFSEETCSLDSFKALRKALNAAKAELAGGK